MTDEAHVLMGLSVEQLQAFNNSAETLATTMQHVTKLMQQTEGRASEFRSWSVTIPQNQPTQLLTFDLSRLLAKLRANVDGCYIGTNSEVQSGGFPLTQFNPFEVKTTDVIWVNYRPATGTGQVANLGVWVEKDVN